METSRLRQLAATINRYVDEIETYRELHSVPSPSFGLEAEPLPEQLAEAQSLVLEATDELHDLLVDPINALHSYGNPQNLAALRVLIRFNIAHCFKPGDETTLSQIANDIGLSNAVTTSVLRLAMTMRIFCEPRKGVIAHTRLSVLMREDRVRNFLSCGLNEMTPASLQIDDALAKWPRSNGPNQTGFCLANNTTESIYEVLQKDSSRALRFSATMLVFTSGSGFEPHHVVDGFDWKSLGKASVVDVGGSRGSIAKALTKQYPLLQVTVQDMASAIAGAEAEVPQEVSNRIKFMEHDFFTRQPVVADVYFLRWILHNWSDENCVKILQSLVPALRPGARIVVQEMCMPEPGMVPLWRERELRQIDLGMLALFNGRERDAEDWKRLFELADSRFGFDGVTCPDGSALFLITATWEKGFKE